MPAVTIAFNPRTGSCTITIDFQSSKMNSGTAKAKTFLRADFNVPAAMADEAAGILVANGALGCAVKAPFSPNPQRSKTVRLEAFFDRLTPSQLARIGSTLAAAGMLSNGQRRPAAHRIVDPGWSTLWKRRFTPLRIGRRLLIVPPWNQVEVRGRLRLVIEPAQAFGTGHHPTTRGVLTLLEAECARRHFQSALDVGTGSGVLAIAMNLLGVADVVGIDNDPVALASARHNAALNRLDRGIRFSPAPLASLRRRFELIAANITAGALVELSSKLKQLLAPDGRLILSGMLTGEVRPLMARYRPELRCLASRIERGWATLVLGR
jgi:ribosomal protein L11 methyltransferase